MITKCITMQSLKSMIYYIETPQFDRANEVSHYFCTRVFYIAKSKASFSFWNTLSQKCCFIPAIPAQIALFPPQFHTEDGLHETTCRNSGTAVVLFVMENDSVTLNTAMGIHRTTPQLRPNGIWILRYIKIRRSWDHLIFATGISMYWDGPQFPCVMG